MKKKVLITGSNGFLGGGLWQYLHDRPAVSQVFGLDIRKKSSDSRSIVCDLKNPLLLKRHLSKIRPDYIFHCAGGSRSDRHALMKENFRTTQVLFESIAGIKNYRPRIIIPGSAAEYGQPPRGVKKIDEDVFPHPITWYGLVKYLQTNLGLMYARSGFDVVVGRIFNIAGYGTPPGLVIGQFAQQIVAIEKSGKAQTIETGDLSGQRDFLDIEDVCPALLSIAERGKTGQVYNICSAKNYLIRDLLKKFIAYSTVKNITVREREQSVSESFNTIGSNSKIKKATGWTPRVSINQILKNTLEYYRGFSADH